MKQVRTEQCLLHEEAVIAGQSETKRTNKMVRAGIKLAVVSNFDTRLRGILEGLRLLSAFDAVVISAEVLAEKPNPLVFEKACAQLGVSPAEALVLGDDRRSDALSGTQGSIPHGRYL